MLCKFCNKECKNDNSKRNHERFCKLNENRQISPLVKYRESSPDPWNKGLTKDTDIRLMEQSKILSIVMKDVIASGKHSGAWHSEYWTPEKRLAKSDEKKKLYLEFPEKHPNRKLAGNKKKMTYPEQVAFNWFNSNNIIVECQKRISNKYVDFCIGSIVVEIDGERWHPIGNENDKIRDEELSKLGYIIYRIRSKEKIEERLKEIFLTP